MRTSDELLEYLKANQIETETFEHPPVRTVDEAQSLCGHIPGLHTKNLFLRDHDKKYFLFVTEDSAVVQLKEFGRKIGAKGSLSFASPEALMQFLGVEPGSVSLLALINDAHHDVTVVIDSRVSSASTVNCHPLTNTRTTTLSGEGLVAFLALTGHAPIYVSLSERKPDSPEYPAF